MGKTHWEMAESRTRSNGGSPGGAGGRRTQGRKGGSSSQSRARRGRDGQRGNGRAAEAPKRDALKRAELRRQTRRKMTAKREKASGVSGQVVERSGKWSLDDFDHGFMRRQLPLWNLLTDHYFRMEVEGWHRLPDPPALFVGVHAGGILPIDAWTLGFLWYRRFEGERILHGTAHDALMATPVLGSAFRKLGVLPAAPDSMAAALAAGRDVAVFPGGDVDAMRPWRQRDRVVLAGRKGFVKLATRAGVPIVPVATVGGADTVFILTDGRRLARAVGLNRLARSEVFPIAAGIPYGIAPAILPFLPLPAKIRTEMLEPVDVDPDPERADDERYLDRVYREVESRLQDGVDRLARRRSFPILG